MQKTIQLTIGLIIALIVFGILINYVHISLISSKNFEITNNRTTISGDNIIVSWKTSKETNGQVEFSDSTNVWHGRDDEFSQTHRITYNISGIPAGTIITHVISACTISGECIKADSYSTTR